VGTNHISGTAEPTIVKYCTQVRYVKSQHKTDKSSLKGAWSGSRDPFSTLMPAIIFAERLKQKSPNFVRRSNISSAGIGMSDYPWIGVVRVTWPVFLNFAPKHFFRIGEVKHLKFLIYRSTTVCMIHFPQKHVFRVCELFKFWEISNNISEIVHERDIVAMED